MAPDQKARSDKIYRIVDIEQSFYIFLGIQDMYISLKIVLFYGVERRRWII